MMVRWIVLVVTLLSFSVSSSALMPPHVRSISPADGTVLKDNTIKIHGYSLGYIERDKAIKIVNVATGKPVAFKHTLNCKTVGECGDNYKPGSCQSKCVITVIIQPQSKRSEVKLTVLRDSATFIVLPAKPQKTPKKAR